MQIKVYVRIGPSCSVMLTRLDMQGQEQGQGLDSQGPGQGQGLKFGHWGVLKDKDFTYSYLLQVAAKPTIVIKQQQ